LSLNGRFCIEKQNNLVYFLNEPASWRRQYGLPSKISFQGNWRLNENHDLELHLAQTKAQFKIDTLTIKGEILEVGGNTLAFRVKSYNERGFLQVSILELSVTWFVGEGNCLSFLVRKEKPDVITFQGAWKLNSRQQITYTYEKENLKTKTKSLQTLTFEGFWQLDCRNALSYILKHSGESKFDFRAQIQSPTLYPQQGLIKYRLGTGLRQAGKKKQKVICLYGDWKINKGLNLSFQMDYGNRNFQSIEFQTEVNFDQKNQIVFKLKNKAGESLGINVIFTHKFLKKLDAQLFLRLKSLPKEKRIETGVSIPF
jgi:hypothetical protein